MDNTTKGPHVTFGGLRCALAGFRAHIIGSADNSHCLTLSVHDLTDSKVSNFDSVISCNEQVLGLDVSVDDLPIV